MHANFSSVDETRKFYSIVYGVQYNDTFDQGPIPRNRVIRYDQLLHRKVNRRHYNKTPANISYLLKKNKAVLIEELWRRFDTKEASGCVYNESLVSILLPRTGIHREDPTKYTLSDSHSQSSMLLRRVSVQFIDTLIQLYILALFPDYVPLVANKNYKCNPFSSNKYPKI